MKFLCALLLFAVSCGAQTYNSNILPSVTGLDLGSTTQQWDVFARNLQVYGSYVIPIYRVSQLASLPATNGNTVIVRDGTVSNDCGIGGGYQKVLCVYYGDSWTAVGGAGSEIDLLTSSYLDTDGTLAANSDSKVATQKATKTYVDTVAATKAASAPLGYVDVREFGVVDDPTGALDQGDKYQAAINYAISVGRSIFQPCMTVMVNKPLYWTGNYSGIEGPPSRCAVLQNHWQNGPLLYLTAPVGAGTGKFKPPIFSGNVPVTGTTQSYSSPDTLGQEGFYLSTMGNPMVFDGKSALTVETWVCPNCGVGSGHATQGILNSSGYIDATFSPPAKAFQILYDQGNHQIQAGFTTTGTCTSIATMSSGVNSVPADLWSLVSLEFTGSAENLYINGVKKATYACTGTVVQAGYEAVTLGWGQSLRILMNNSGIYSFSGLIGPTRFSNNARYGGSDFTPPTATWNYDSNTQAVINWDENVNQVMWGAKTSQMSGGYSYFQFSRPTYGGGTGAIMSNVTMKNMRFYGSVIASSLVYGNFTNDLFSVGSFGGFYCDNNCYLINFRDSKFYPNGGTPQFGLGLGSASGLAVLDNVSCTSHKYCIMLNTASAWWHGNAWLENNSITEWGIVALNSHLLIDGTSWSAENGLSSTKFKGNLYFGDTSNLYNLSIKGSNGETDYQPFFTLNGGTVSVENFRMDCFTHLPSVFAYRTGVVKPNRVSFRNTRSYNCSTTPWASSADLVYAQFEQSGLNPLGTVGSGSVTVDPSRWEAYTATLSAAMTSLTVNNAIQGMRVNFTICQNGTGGYAWTWPANFLGAMTVDTTASKCSSQGFQYDGTNWYPTDAGKTGY